jgi:hypothetical protein
MNTPLQQAAQGLLTEFDKMIYTAAIAPVVDALRKALADEQAQAVEPVTGERAALINESWYWVRNENMGGDYGPWTPAQCRLPANAFYSVRFSGTPVNSVIVGPVLVAPTFKAQQVAVPLSDFEMPPAFGEIQYQRPSGQWGRVEGYTRNQMREAVAAAIAKTEVKQAQQVAVPVPLSDEQIVDWMWGRDLNRLDEDQREQVFLLIRDVEAHHKIGEKP